MIGSSFERSFAAPTSMAGGIDEGHGEPLVPHPRRNRPCQPFAVLIRTDVRTHGTSGGLRVPLPAPRPPEGQTVDGRIRSALGGAREARG